MAPDKRITSTPPGGTGAFLPVSPGSQTGADMTQIARPADNAGTPAELHGRRRLRIDERPISSLTPFPSNARTHSTKQIHQIAASIREFGFTNPVLIDQHGMVIAGHGRVEAARLLNWPTVPTIQIENLSDAQKRAYVIADNKLALNAGWDAEILAIELQNLSTLDVDFDLEITGFETAEVDLLIDGPSKKKPDDGDDFVPLPDPKTVSQLGDLWVLGEHRLMCADARDQATYAALLGSERARAVFADPPYNVPIEGHVCGLGTIKHREFAMACGEMTGEQFKSFLSTVFQNAAEVSLDGAIHFICMDWRHIGEVMAIRQAIYSELKNVCVWNKDNGGMGSFYRSKHELVFVFKVGSGPHVNTIELGRSGRYRTNVWDYAGVNTMRPGRLDDLAIHPTVKPVALVMDALKDCSRRGEVVLDPFAGSGTTLIAAEKCRRRARLVEIDPAYVDVAIRRWQRFTGSMAVHAESGQSFAARMDDPISGAGGERVDERSGALS
jgi:DNA modification methylase